MILLVTLLWPALAASFVLGAGIGRLAGPPRPGPARWGAIVVISAACAAGGLALTGLVPGRAGAWLDQGALVLGAYLLGATLLAMIRPRIGPER